MEPLRNKLIAFAGQLQNGKDTAADYLAKELEWGRESFARGVKQVFMDNFTGNPEFIEEWKRKNEIPVGFNKTVRQSLQWIGDGFRGIQTDVWVNKFFDRIRAYQNIGFVLSDERYVSEAQEIKKCSGMNILLYRPGFENDDPHPSESELKPLIDWCKENLYDSPIPFDREDMPEDLKYFDFFLVNDGTIEDLYDKIDKLLIPYVENYFNDG